MNDELHRLVYLSRNKIQGDVDTICKEITQILRAAREHNVKQDVTGALMFNAGCFAQVLEGRKENVQTIFDRIEHDTRHSEVVILDFSPVQKRAFPEWSMAYMGEDEALDDRFFMIAEETNFDMRSLSGNKSFDVLLKNLRDADSLPLRKFAA